MTTPIKLNLFAESFKFDGKKVSGVAIHPKKLWHSEEGFAHVYLRDELKKSAPTLSGKPFGIDHLYLLPKPNVIEKGWYDDVEDGVAFEGSVDNDIAQKIKEGVFKGLSIELDWFRPGVIMEKVNGLAPKNFDFTSVHFMSQFPPADKEAYVKLWEGIAESSKEPQRANLEEKLINSLEKVLKSLKKDVSPIEVIDRTNESPIINSERVTPHHEVDNPEAYPTIQITPDKDEETLLAEWQRGKAALLQRDRDKSFDEARRAVSAWKPGGLLRYKEIPPVEVLRQELLNQTKHKIAEDKAEWLDDLQDFKQFLQMIEEKSQQPEEKLDMSFGACNIGPTMSQQLFKMLVEIAPSVKKAIPYVEEIICVYDERLKFFAAQETQIPIWLKEAENLSNSARKPAEKFNKLLLQAKEFKRTDKPTEAEKALKKAIPIKRKYGEIQLKFDQIAGNLQRNSTPHPYFPEIVRSDLFDSFLRKKGVEG